MISKTSFWNILFRIVISTSLAIGLAYSYFHTELLISPIMFGILLILSSIEMFWHLRRQERNWVKFLQSIEFKDFNRTYENNTTSKELTEAYHLITKSMEELESNKQAEFRLLQTVLGHVSIAVVCFRENGEVMFSNKAFNTLLNLQGINNIDKLKNVYPSIHEVMITNQSVPSEWVDHSDGQKLFIKTEVFKLKDVKHKLVSLTDIRSSLEAKELESYQKLMRVMTHEIMNSTTPILSLISIINKKLIQGSRIVELNTKDQDNVATSLRAIEERTSGILRFVESYKEINRSISPQLALIESKELLGMIPSLVNPHSHIGLTVNDGINDKVLLDGMLISQVLINLVKNAVEALADAETGEICITLKKQSDIIIEIEDNGPGVSQKDFNQIFIPFYTTKADGSGVGLALSRKIIKAHGGLLEHTQKDGKTRFTITIPE